jgi:hypothetical protein
MRLRCIAVLALTVLFCCGVSPLFAQHGAAPTTTELLRILRITTYRVRVPADTDHVWDLQVLKSDDVKRTGPQPRGLTTSTGLLSLREGANGVYQFTLPERGGASSQGEFDLCKSISCEGQWSIRWLETPWYSMDGSQCILAQFSNLSDSKPSAVIALVKVRNKP